MFFYRVQALPICGRITAIDWAGIVELRIPNRNIVAVEIRNVTLGICVNRIVGRIRFQVHHFAEALITTLFGSDIRLLECSHRLPHQRGRCPLPLLGMGNRTVVGAVNGKNLFLYSGIGRVFKQHRIAFNSSPFVTVLVDQLFSALLHIFYKFIDHIGVGRSMHPTCLFIESLVDEKLAPGNCAIGVQAFFTHHMHFSSEVERGVRIDE